jgi:1-acyl-sn-glycerol-3-phosphate acyltransferase
VPPRHTPLYRLTHVLVRILLRLYVGFRVAGADRVPRGAALVIANHPSALDPLVLAAALPRRGVFIAAAEFLSWRLVGWAMRAYGVIPVRRGQVDVAALRQAARALAAGALVVIFPEGQISPEGGPAKAGAGLLASHTRVPVVPAAIVGTARALPLGRYVPRPAAVRVIFGRPLPPPSDDRAAAERVVAAALSWAHRAAGIALDIPSSGAKFDGNTQSEQSVQ